MNWEFADVVPCGPDWSIDWQMIDDRFDWFRALKDCPQDLIHHAEGDVHIHTKMVCEALVDQPSWRKLDEDDRCLMFWTALLHDVAKPRSTRIEPDGRVRSPGHSRHGQIMARKILWLMGLEYARREMLCHLITHHQLPFFAIDKEDAARRVHLVSYQTRCDLLAMLAEADAQGRICADQDRLLDSIELFRELCRQEKCFTAPKVFASAHSRFCYFRMPHRSPDYEAYDDTRSQVTMLSGLPASGKDSFIAGRSGDATIVSLDAIRAELKIGPEDNQGPVVASARERARQALRTGEPLIWNATNLSREFRQPLLGLFADYNAAVNIVYAETSPSEQARRNNERPDPVPGRILERMLTRWEPPDLTECHGFEIVLS